MKMTNIEAIKDLNSFFISKFKPKCPVKLRICKLKGYHGLYQWDSENKAHFISIEKRNNFTTQAETLIHEWGHLLDSYKNGGINEHSDSWALKYAKTYRAYLEWLDL